MISLEDKIWIVKRAIEARQFRSEPIDDLLELKEKLNCERRSQRTITKNKFIAD